VTISFSQRRAPIGVQQQFRMETISVF